MTKEQALTIYESGIWRQWTDEQKARFQLFEDRLCMPFGEFHRAVEAVLGRPVWTHEFASSNQKRIQAEFLKEAPAPTLQEIMDLIPADKRILIGKS